MIVRLEAQIPAQLTDQVRQGLLDELLEGWLQTSDSSTSDSPM